MLLVMLQTYDLKGSERNRLVKAARKPGKEEVVLLDENFLHGERTLSSDANNVLIICFIRCHTNLGL